ncbi:MAG TPA: hypothetical protein VGK73_08600 [Polyangiaceae bacterium]
MSIYNLVGSITGTSPATASTAVIAGTVANLQKYDEIHVEADLVGATGGTLDVYIQRKLANNLWRDWVHFTQLASGGAAVKHSVRHGAAAGLTVTGGGTDAAPGVALAANAQVGGHPGTEIRVVCVAGTSTSAGAAVTLRVFGLKK